MKTKLFTHKMRKTLVAFAAVCGLLSSTTVSAADLTATVSKDSVESCSVSTTLSSSWSVTIPKNITLGVDSSTQTATSDYDISVYGDIEDEHFIMVEPDNSFVMSNDNSDVTATVMQSKTTFGGNTFTPDVPSATTGNVTVSGLRPGEWAGNFDFHIAELTHICNYENYHCIVCGDVDPKHPHNYENYHCTICGSVEPGHEHEYGLNGICVCSEENPDVDFVTFSKDAYSMIRQGTYDVVASKDIKEIYITDKTPAQYGYKGPENSDDYFKTDLVDISDAGDGSVVGWLSMYKGTSYNSATIYIAPAHEGTVLRAPADISGLFGAAELAEPYSVTVRTYYGSYSNNGMRVVDFSKVTNVDNMFGNISRLTADLSGCNFPFELTKDMIAPNATSGTITFPDGTKWAQ